MTTGMFWLCVNKNLSLLAHIQEAAAYYEKKYGRKPELCLLNVKMLNGQTPAVEGITVRSSRFVLPQHLWIGVEDMPTERKEVTPL